MGEEVNRDGRWSMCGERRERKTGMEREDGKMQKEKRTAQRGQSRTGARSKNERERCVLVPSLIKVERVKQSKQRRRLTWTALG